MTNNKKTVEIEEKPEKSMQSVSQPSANVSSGAPSESLSASSSKETEPKLGGSSEATNTVNISSNKSTITPLKETDDILKRPFVEEDKEVKPKKHKEDHKHISKGKNEASSHSKPYSNDNKSFGLSPSFADSSRGGLKVPSLKIVIPTVVDSDMDIRSYGKNRLNNSLALPYIVSSKESPPASNKPNSSKSLQKATSDTIGTGEQKFLQTRILRSSNRCDSGAPSCSTSPIIPDKQLGQTTPPGAMTVDAKIAKTSNSSSSPAIRSKQNEYVLTTISVDNKQATTSAAATMTTASSESTLMAEVSGKELPLRRRKLKASRTESKTTDASAPNVVTNLSGTTSESVPVTNCYQMFLDIRKQIDEKHKSLYPVKPKPPSGFKDYLMNKRTYVLAGNYNSRVVNTQNPTPANLHKQLIKLFVEQEKERQRLHLQHIVEKEKLVLSVEQEILRVHGRAARALANQLLPFSVCAILKDDEVYNIVTPEQEEKKNRQTRSRYNGRLFLSWLQDVDNKWEKIKESLLLRHHNEAESLHAVQKMDWGWKLKELQLCTYSSEPNIDEQHVPIVLVSDDLDLLPT